jgi:hypothetical protein
MGRVRHSVVNLSETLQTVILSEAKDAFSRPEPRTDPVQLRNQVVEGGPGLLIWHAARGLSQFIPEDVPCIQGRDHRWRSAHSTAPMLF